MEYCLECDFVGQPKQYRPGTFGLQVLLWLFFLIPPAIYAIGRLSVRYQGVIYSLWKLSAPYRPETLGTEVTLWLIFLVPGVIYSIWRLSARYEGCAQCGSRRVVPLDSPLAQAALRRLSPTLSARSWVCMACGKPIFSGGRFCPSCGASLETPSE